MCVICVDEAVAVIGVVVAAAPWYKTAWAKFVMCSWRIR